MEVDVTNPSEYSRHVLEDGTAITDNQINQLRTISVKGMITSDDWEQQYKGIDNAREAATRFIIQTRVDTYDLMYITQIEYREKPDIQHAIQLDINFVEQRIVAPEQKEVKKPKYSGVIGTGTVLPRAYQPISNFKPLDIGI